MRQKGWNEGREWREGSRVVVLMPLGTRFSETGRFLNHRPGEVSCLFVHGIYQAGSTQEAVGRNQLKGPVRLNFRSSCPPGNYRQSPKLGRKTEGNRSCPVETPQ